MKFVLLTVKSTKPEWIREGLADYLRKIDPLQKIEMIEVGSSANSRDQSEKKKREESKALLQAIKDDDYVWLFDERGQNLDSQLFAKKLNQGLLSGKKRLIFVIGGAYGVEDPVSQRADLRVSLAPFVLNHWIAQVVSLEQIYRGLSILKGLPYHNS